MILGCQKGQSGLQRFDRHSACGSCLGSHVKAEQPEAQGGTLRQLQPLASAIHSSDLGDHESDPGAIGEAPQINRGVLSLVDPGNHPGNHAGVQSGAVPVHQDHGSMRSPPRLHGPAAEQKGMAMAATGQHKGALRDSGRHEPLRYPFGFACCQAQPSRHMSSSVRLACQPSTSAAL